MNSLPLAHTVPSPWNDWEIRLLDDIHSLEPDGEIEGHYGSFVSGKPHALFESGEDGPVVIRVTFDDREEVYMRALLGIICMDSPRPAIPVGVLEFGIFGFDHPPCCPERISWREEWLLLCHGGGEVSNRKKRDGVYPCLFPVRKWKNLNFSSLEDLSLVECLQLHPIDSCFRPIISRMWRWRGDFY